MLKTKETKQGLGEEGRLSVWLREGTHSLVKRLTLHPQLEGVMVVTTLVSIPQWPRMIPTFSALHLCTNKSPLSLPIHTPGGVKVLEISDSQKAQVLME